MNNNNGARLETYIIPGKRGSGVICLNGAAARLVQEGDKVIIISYKMMSDQEAAILSPFFGEFPVVSTSITTNRCLFIKMDTSILAYDKSVTRFVRKWSGKTVLLSKS